MKPKFTSGPWISESIPGHLYTLKNLQGEIILRIRSGMDPSYRDQKLLNAAPDLYAQLSCLVSAWDFAKRTGAKFIIDNENINIVRELLQKVSPHE